MRCALVNNTHAHVAHCLGCSYSPFFNGNSGGCAGKAAVVGFGILIFVQPTPAGLMTRGRPIQGPELS